MSSNPATLSGASVLIGAAALVVVVAGMRAAQPIIVPFLLAIFVAVACAPSLAWLEQRRLPRSLAMLVVVSAIIAVAVGLSMLVGSSIRDFSGAIPEYQSRVKVQFQPIFDWLNNRGISVSSEEVINFVDPGKAIRLAGDMFNSLGGVLANAFLIFLTTVFILIETSSFPQKLKAIVSDPEHSMARFHLFTDNLNRYLAIKTATSLGTGVVIGIWLAILQVDYPVLWGILAFLLNYVPNIGSIIAAVPAVLLAFVQLGPATALWGATGYLFVNILFGSVIEPRYMGQGLGLSTLVVFLSLIFWGWVLGPVGMFLSVPLTMTAKIALDARDDTRWVAVMLGPEKAVRTGSEHITSYRAGDEFRPERDSGER